MTDPFEKPGTLLENIVPPKGSDQSAAENDPSVPRNYGLRIAHDGTWYHQGTPINRKALVKLFSKVLRREDDGFWLVTPAERGRIEVEDAPFTAVELAVTGAGRRQELGFRTNVDDWVVAGPEHPIRVETVPDTGAPRPYILVRGRLEALILRSVFYELVQLAETEVQDEGVRLGLWSQETFFPLGRVQETS